LNSNVTYSNQLVEFQDHCGDDLKVVKMAKVSFAADETVQRFIDDIEAEGLGCRSHSALIRYLAKHGHWTPFAHTMVTFRVRAPIPMRTQCFKHKAGFVENEESRRYISVEPTFFMPRFRESCPNKKQGSAGNVETWVQNYAENIGNGVYEYSLQAYKDLLSIGVCEEQARFFLPQGMHVNWMWSGSVAAYARFYRQRTSPTAQKETGDLAHAVAEHIEPLFPVSWAALTGGGDDV